MKIGIDGRLWSETGVGRYIRNLVRELEKIDKKNEYVLFGNTSVIHNSKFIIQNNFKVINTNIRWHSLQEQLQFSSIVEKENIDLMHFPYFSVPLNYHKPFVVTIHDLIINQFGTGRASTLPLPFYKIKRLGYKLVLKQAVKRARKIIAVSEATKAEIVKRLGVDSEKIIVTYEGVESRIAYGVSHIEKNHKPSAISYKRFFLYVGNAYPHKNLERLIEAFDIFQRDSSVTPQNDITLILVGKEDYFYKRLKEKVNEMELSDKVIFHGQVSDEELVYLYKNAVALVSPSLMEGFGLPVLEAMANECPLIISDIAAFREIVEDNAVYFNPYDVDDIVKKMEYVIHSNDTYHHSKKVKEGLERLREFSWEKMAKQTLKIYEEAASS
jgi:glycosyltransferase involved in cell wall biosynthesis